jgi:hypothetical protein
MRRIVIILTASLISASNLSAQVTSYHFNFHIGGGFLKATEHRGFQEFWNSGYNIYGGLSYGLSDEFEIGLRAGHSEFPVNEEKAAERAYPMGADSLQQYKSISITTVNLLIKLNFYKMSSKTKAYFLFNAGWAWPNGAFIKTVSDYGDTIVVIPLFIEREETIAFGAGIDREISEHAGFFVELTYRIIFQRQKPSYFGYPLPVTDWLESNHADFYRLAAGLRYSLRY